ncbi:MAG: disulfide bond formation protein B [Bdellovibrionales bacterium]
MTRFVKMVAERYLNIPAVSLALFAACTGSLLIAYVAEHYFDVFPCILCVYQRIPYALVAFLALFAFMFRRHDMFARRMLALCALAFLVNGGIAVYHSGVELHWWAGTDECSVNPFVLKEVAKPENLREALLQTPLVNCDEINFTFMGYTMANWNILASLGLAIVAFMGIFSEQLKQKILR